MDCAQISRAFIDGATPTSASVSDHVAQCPPCAQLFDGSVGLGSHLGRTVAVLPTRRAPSFVETETLLEREHGMRAFLRSRSTRVRWALALALPACLLARELLRGRVDLRGLSASRSTVGILLAVAVAALAYLSLRPLPLAKWFSRLHWSFVLLAWALPCVLWLLPEPRATATPGAGQFALSALACLGYGSALAAPCFGLLWALDRNTRASYRALVLAAATVTVLANLVLLVHCPITARSHLIAGHSSIGVAWFLAVSIAAWWSYRTR